MPFVGNEELTQVSIAELNKVSIVMHGMNSLARKSVEDYELEASLGLWDFLCFIH